MKAAFQFVFNYKVVFMQNAIALIDVFFGSNFDDAA